MSSFSRRRNEPPSVILMSFPFDRRNWTRFGLLTRSVLLLVLHFHNRKTQTCSVILLLPNASLFVDSFPRRRHALLEVRFVLSQLLTEGVAFYVVLVPVFLLAVLVHHFQLVSWRHWFDVAPSRQVVYGDGCAAQSDSVPGRCRHLVHGVSQRQVAGVRALQRAYDFFADAHMFQ